MRREQILLDLKRANAAKVEKAKAIARREHERRASDSKRLAQLIQSKMQRAASSRSRIQLNIRSKASSGGSRPRRRSRSDSMKKKLLNAQFHRVSAARMRRQEGFNRMRARVVAHLDKVKRQHKKLKTVRLLQEWWKQAMVCSRRVQRLKDANGAALLETILMPISDEDDFDRIAAHLTTPTVIQAMKKLLQTTCFPPSAREVSLATVRAVLAAFIINRQAELVVGKVRNEAVHATLCRNADLVEKAQVELLASLRSGRKINSKILLFRAVRREFSRGFSQWKRTDAVRLSEQILATYLKVEATLRDYEKRAAKQSKGSSAKDPGLEQLIQGTKAQLAELQAKCKRILSKEDYNSWVAEAAARSPKKVKSNAKEPKEPEAEPTSGGRARARTASLPMGEAPELPPNDVIVHALLLDPAYKLCEDVDPVYDEAQEQFDTNPFFEIISEQLCSGNALPFLDALEEIGSRLKQTIPNRKDIHQKIDEELHKSTAAAIEAGEFGNDAFASRVSYLESLITSLQAPARTTKTKAGFHKIQQILESTDWREVAPFVLDFAVKHISQLERDLANAHVSLLAGAINNGQGVQYVLSSFRKRMQRGEFSLGKSGIPSKAEAWMAPLITAGRSVNEAIAVGFAELLCTEVVEEDLFAAALPETIGLYNAPALRRLNEEVCRLSLQVVVEIMLCQVVTKAVHANLAEFRESVRKVSAVGDSDALAAVVLQVAITIDPTLAQKDLALLRNLIKNAPGGTVYSTILRRFKSLMVGYLKSLNAQSSQAEQYLPTLKAGREALGSSEGPSAEGSTEYKRRAIAALSKVGLRRAGLVQWEEQTQEILKGVGEVYLLNLRIFGALYEPAFEFLSKQDRSV